MRIAHTSDWHLGHRRFDRVTPTGINVREADVARSFSRLIEALIVVEPNVILVAGDVFDQVHPSNHAVVHALSEIARLRKALPETPILMLAGNHDAPRSSATGSILPIFAQHGVRVSDRGTQRIRLGSLSVLCVPDAPGVDRSNLTPDPDAEWNVLLLHGEIDGVTQAGARHPDVTLDQVGDDWDLIALGHFHDVERVGERAWYAGAIDLVSSNVWAEKRTKGFLVHDLDTDEHEFIELPATRAVVDLPAIDGNGLAAVEIDERIFAALGSIDGGFDGAIVRQIVANVSRETRRALDQRAIKTFQRRCLSFALDVRKPDRLASLVATPGNRRLSLEEFINTHLSDPAKTPLPPDVDRAEFLARAHAYVAEAYGAEAAGPAPDHWTQSPESNAAPAAGVAA